MVMISKCYFDLKPTVYHRLILNAPSPLRSLLSRHSHVVKSTASTADLQRGHCIVDSRHIQSIQTSVCLHGIKVALAELSMQMQHVTADQVLFAATSADEGETAAMAESTGCRLLDRIKVFVLGGLGRSQR